MNRILSILLVLLLVLEASAQDRTIREATVAEITAGTKGLPVVVTPRRLGAFSGGGGSGGVTISNAYALTWALNTRYTNTSAHTLSIYQCVHLLSVVGGQIAQVSLYVDSNNNGGYESTENRAVNEGEASSAPKDFCLTTWVPSGGVWLFTNLTVGGGSTASVVASSGIATYFATNSGSGGGGSGILTTNGSGTNTINYLNTDANHTLVQATTGGPPFLTYSVSYDTLIFGHTPIGNGSGFTNLQGLAGTNSGVDPYRDIYATNGMITLSAYNTTTNGGHTVVAGRQPGFYFKRQDDNSDVGFLGMWDDHASAAATPEMIIQSDGSIALINGFDRENQNVQIGKNQYPSGFANLGHAGFGINDGLTHLTQPGWGHGQRLIFPSTTAGATYAYPGIQSLNAGSNAVYGGYGLGELLFYTVAPLWGVGSGFTNTPGILTMRMKTNALEVPGDGFIGNTRYLTNWQYAVYHESLISSASPRLFAAAAFTNVIFTTNATLNSDTSSAFTLSNSFLIVTTNGAGTWKVRAEVNFWNGTDSSGAVLARLRRFNNTPITLLAGSSGYQYDYSSPQSTIMGVVTLTAGDLLGLQAYATGGTANSIGRLVGSGEEFPVASIEFERK